MPEETTSPGEMAGSFRIARDKDDLMHPIDIDRARADTPGCDRVVHLNNAGGSLPPRVVTDAVVGYVQREALTGAYEQAAMDADVIDRYRPAAASLLNADESEIAFAFNDTLAFSTTFWGLAATGAIAPNSSVLVDRGVYVSHYLGLLQAEKQLGIKIRVIESTADGSIDLESLRSLLEEQVSLVQLTHIGTHRGLVNPVIEAGALIRSAGQAIYALDACQSLGHIPVDVRAIDCDLLSGTGRKFLRAPRGTGLIFVSRRLLDRIDPPGIDGHSANWIDQHTYQLLPDARRFEPFEVNMATKVGLGVAIDYALSWGIDAIAERVTTLADLMRSLLTTNGIEVLDGGQRRSGIVTFRLDHESPASTQHRLAAEGINTTVVRPGSARLDMETRGVSAAVRASVHYYNTVEEIDRLMEVLSAPAR